MPTTSATDNSDDEEQPQNLTSVRDISYFLIQFSSLNSTVRWNQTLDSREDRSHIEADVPLGYWSLAINLVISRILFLDTILSLAPMLYTAVHSSLVSTTYELKDLSTRLQEHLGLI